MYNFKTMPKAKFLALMLKQDLIYYNSGDMPELSDALYEEARELFAKRFPRHSYNEQVGAPVASGGVKLPYPIGSLAKGKPKSTALASFIDYKGAICLSDKMDGITCVVTYSKRCTPAYSYTRGNGGKANKSASKAQVLNIPKKLSVRLDVRGEVILPERTFRKIRVVSTKDDGYTTSRGAAAGAMNKKGTSPILRKVHFIAFRIMNKPYSLMPLGKQLKLLKSEGFKVVPHRRVTSVTVAQLTEYHAQRIAKSKYDIDGIVIEREGANPPVAGRPKYAIAFKENSAEDSVLVKVIKVEWRTSRTGAIIPRIHIEPTIIGGVTVQHFTGRNYQFIQNGFNKGEKRPKRPINVGTVMRAVRSGKVIPHIEEIVKGSRTASKPDIDFDLKGVDAVATNKDDTGTVRRIVHFYDTLGIDGFKGGTVKRLVDAGIEDVFTIAQMTYEDFVDAGVGNVAATKISAQISNLDPTIQDLAVASGAFSGYSNSRINAIFDAFPTIYQIYKRRGEEAVFDKIMTLPKFQETTASNFSDGLPAFEKYVTFFAPKQAKARKKVTKGKLLGKSFVFSGFRDKDMQAIIEGKGGEVKSGIVSATTHLIIPDDSYTSSKVDKAENKGIKILTRDKLSRMLKK